LLIGRLLVTNLIINFCSLNEKYQYSDISVFSWIKSLKLKIFFCCNKNRNARSAGRTYSSLQDDEEDHQQLTDTSSDTHSIPVPVSASAVELEEEDVAAERQRVLTEGNSDAVLRIAGVSKTFNSSISGSASDEEKKAVSSVYLNILSGQTFGLLGHNGAGKTTLLNM